MPVSPEKVRGIGRFVKSEEPLKIAVLPGAKRVICVAVADHRCIESCFRACPPALRGNGLKISCSCFSAPGFAYLLFVCYSSYMKTSYSRFCFL